MWSASGDEGEGELKSGVCKISLGRLQYIRWVTAGPTQKTKTKKTYTLIRKVVTDHNAYIFLHAEET
jgi:hypothetical protein